MTTATTLAHLVEELRRQFPALSRTHRGWPVAYFDGPAGTQVPRSVITAVSDYLAQHNANCGAPFATSCETDDILARARSALTDFLGASEPDEVAFGPNMTTLTLALSRALGRTWKAGDEIILSRLDHDANVSPWVLAASDAGATVRYIDVRPEDCMLNLDSFEAALTDRTRLVAVGYASNIAGTINPVAHMVSRAKSVGALTFVDAVHYAPHGLIDVAALGCDFLVCSAYKFFGPHVGVMWGRRELLEAITPYKLRPSPNDLPGRWMTGTQNHEGIAGTLAAVEYLADIGRRLDAAAATRRTQLAAAFQAIMEYERSLAERLIGGLGLFESVKIWGIADTTRLHERVPTVSVTHARLTPREMAGRLAENGIFAWSGNHYALPLTEALGLEPEGTLRIGVVHYNTADEVDRLLAALAEVV